ncbi:hypothetical protein JW877_04320 [bacterium]|nr:hypothetical protein [bacterium]
MTILNILLNLFEEPERFEMVRDYFLDLRDSGVLLNCGKPRVYALNGLLQDSVPIIMNVNLARGRTG